MKQSQMIEMVQQHFPKVSHAEIRVLLNIVRDDFVRESRCSLMSGTATVTDMLGVLINNGGVHEVTEVRMKNPNDQFKSTEIPKITIKGVKSEGAI